MPMENLGFYELRHDIYNDITVSFTLEVHCWKYRLYVMLSRAQQGINLGGGLNFIWHELFLLRSPPQSPIKVHLGHKI